MSGDLKDRSHAELAADKQIGQDAQVTREIEFSVHAEQANKALRRAGHDLLIPGGYQQEHYAGSFAVHMYWSRILNTFTFVVQNCPVETPEWLAGKAVSALRSDIMESYGRKRQTNRAGF